MKTNLILGTAGHIDHGKTSLIRALTGTDTDRLPEEKKRGITIEPGYALLEVDEFRFGIVDVPGHEKFVRQMLSGATGMDLGLLVVAADDSVKRQTIEHLDILKMLDLPAGVIAITKSDLVEPDWLEMVTEEVRDLVKDTFLRDAEIIPTSAPSGMGLDALKKALVQIASRVQNSGGLADPAAPFRMAIDRVFTIVGHGTVVTGSVSSGTISVGDKVEIQPGGIEARIREIQNHEQMVDSISRGQRSAINLAGVHHAQLHRGQELCAVGHLQPARIVSVRIDAIAGAVRPMKDRQRVRFHIGTCEVTASLRLLEQKELAPGQSALAQLFLAQPVVAVWNQPFVLRSESPAETVGGGRILHPDAGRIRQMTSDTRTMLNQLGETEPEKRVAAAVFFQSMTNSQLDDLSRIAGVAEPGPMIEKLVKSGEIIQISLTAHKTWYLHKQSLNQTADQVVQYLRNFHESDPLASGVSRKSVENFFGFLNNRKLFDMAIELLANDGKIRKTGDLITLEGYGPQLTNNERKLLSQIVEAFQQARLEPPTVEQLQNGAGKGRNSVPQLVQLAVDQGQLVRLDDKICLHVDMLDDIKSKLLEILDAGQGITMSDIRQHLNTSRKYAVPLGEYLDAIGFTRREGDLRFLTTRQPAG